MNKPEITSQHQWLQQLIGEWTMEAEMASEPGKTPEKHRGAETVRSLGGLWIICEGRGEMPSGGEAHSVMTLGFDPVSNRFRGTFIASMMTHLWVYDGTLNPARTRLVLDTEGPGMTGDAMCKYQDAIEILSPDHRTLSSQMQNDAGEWQHFMTAHYRRVK